MMLAALFLVAAATGVDPRVTEAQSLAAHGDDAAALSGLLSVLHDVEAAGQSGSAGLHKNIGTLALRTGDTGRSVLHLLSAERRAPHDADIAHNLRLAKDARADRIEGTASTSMGARLPPDAARLAAAAGFALFGLALLLRGWLGRRCPGAVVVVAAVVAAVGATLFAVRFRFEADVVYVVLDDTLAREAPDDKATGFAVHPGLTGLLLQQRGAHVSLRLENGVDVWVAADDVAPVR